MTYADQIRAEQDDATNIYVDNLLTAATAPLQEEIENLQGIISGQEEEIDRLTEQVEDLQKQLAECEDGPPPSHRMLVGVALADFPDGEKEITDYAALMGGLELSRDYDTQLRPGGPGEQPGARIAFKHGLVEAYSIKYPAENTAGFAEIASGQHSAAYQAHLDKWPEGKPGFYLYGNEPDQVKKGIDAATWRAAMERLHTDLTFPEGVREGIVLMSFTAQQGRIQDWLPNIEGPFHVELHVYGRLTHNSMEQYGMDVAVAAIKARGWTWGIGETNADSQPGVDNRGDWLAYCADWAYQNGALYWTLFNVNKDQVTRIEGSPNGVAAVQRITSTYAQG